MGAFVSAFVLYGIALLYGQTGSTRLDADRRRAGRRRRRRAAGRSLGLLLLIAGFGFKMSLVPFHAWSPDVYQGAPSPFVAFLSVAPRRRAPSCCCASSTAIGATRRMGRSGRS